MTLMADEFASFRFLLRNDTGANWTTQNPVLLEGEAGVEVDTHTLKIGDGVTAWNDLDYTGGEGPAGPPGEPGAPGAAGRSVTGVAKTGTAGLVDTYTISYSSAPLTSTFTVTNGAAGSAGTPGAAGSVWRSGSGAPSGALGVVTDWYVDTASANYTYYEKTGASTWTSRGTLKGPAGTNGTDGTNGTNGRGITGGATRISGSGAPGTTDTWQFTYSDATTSTFTVYNGANGSGAGDVVGPASSVTGNLPTFSNTGGKALQDSGVAVSSLAPLNSPTFTGTVAGITKSMVGLSNVDNTTDVGKPVSTAQQTALNLKANLASPTFSGTIGQQAPTLATDTAYSSRVAGDANPRFSVSTGGTHSWGGGTGGTDTTMSRAGAGLLQTGAKFNAVTEIQEGGVRVYSPNNKPGVTGLSATGTADATTFLRGDNTWAVPTASVAAASETVSGIAELATQAETNAGTDDLRIVTPLKFQTRMAAYAQPLDATLTALAALTTAGGSEMIYLSGVDTFSKVDTTSFGRGFLSAFDAAAARALTGAEPAARAINTQTTTSYTLVLADAQKVVTISNASNNILVVPPNSSVAFPIGTYIEIANLNTGDVAISPGSGVLLRSAAGLKVIDQYGVAGLRKIATDEWVVMGRTSV